MQPVDGVKLQLVENSKLQYCLHYYGSMGVFDKIFMDSTSRLLYCYSWILKIYYLDHIYHRVFSGLMSQRSTKTSPRSAQIYPYYHFHDPRMKHISKLYTWQCSFPRVIFLHTSKPQYWYSIIKYQFTIILCTYILIPIFLNCSRFVILKGTNLL